MKLRLKSPMGIALIVLALIALLFLAIRGDTVKKSREAVLRTDLRMMRDAIDHYTLDKQKPPYSLQDLVDAGYLRAIPVDPMTLERDWVPVLGDPIVTPDLQADGFYDVHSNSSRVATNGSRYNTW